MKTETVWLQRPGADVPWGFRLQGGADKGSPLTVCRVSPGSIASTGVSVGDVILRLGEADTANLTHDQAQYYIKEAGNLLQLHIRKGGNISPGVHSPQSEKVAASDYNHHHPTMTSSTAGVHDLFRDMYGSSTQPSHHSPDFQPYMSRPPPVAATPSAYSPAPYSSQNTSDQQIPIQVHHASPSVLYKAEYAGRDEDKPKPYVAKVQEESSVPSSHFTAVSDMKSKPFVAKSFSDSSTPPPPPGGKVYSMKPPTKPPPNSPVNPRPGGGQSSPDFNRPINYPNAQTKSQPSPPTTPGQGSYTPYINPRHVSSPVQRDGQFSPSHEANKAPFSNRKPRPFFASPLRQPLDSPDSGGVGFPTPPPEAGMPAVYAGASTPTSAPPTPSTLTTPPLPPPPAPSSPAASPSSKPPGKDSQYANKLSEQLANMDMHNSPMSPTQYGTPPDYSSPSGGYQDYNSEPTTNYTDNYNQSNFDNYNNPDSYSYDQPAASTSPQYNSSVPNAPPLPVQQPSYSRSQPTPPPVMPDAVLNMAAKGAPDKKPWAYAPDADMLKEHRDRVRRRGAGSLPRYQNLLNMPSFEDPPAPVSNRPPSAQSFSTATDPQNLKAGAAGSVVAHAQYNSPLGLYTEDNVLDAFSAQTDGQVTNVRTVSAGGGKASGGPDITQSAVYKMIHGLDESQPSKPSPYRQASEGTAPQQLPPHACSQSLSDSTNSLNVEEGYYSNSIPHTTRSPLGLNRGQARQGLSFLVLQCLYDDQEEPLGTSSDVLTSGGSGSLSPASSLPSTPGSMSSTPGHHGNIPDYLSDGSLSPNSTNIRNVHQLSRGFRSPRRQPSMDDETSFSGVGGRSDTYDHIPSRAFQKLQSLTGGSEVDRSSIRSNVTGDDEDENEVSPYNEASIRYKGGNIPSKAFRMLKSMTGGDDDLPPVSAKPTRRHLRRAESAPGPQDDDRDGGVDISYVGAHIPSKSFRMLQKSIGADPSDYDSGVQNGMEEPMVVAPGDAHAAARERRRRRRRGSLPRTMSPSPQRRPIIPREPPHEAKRDEFDEASYLAGRIPIVRSEDEVMSNPVARKTIDEAAAEHEKHEAERLMKNRPEDREFDEKKWLRGENPVWGGSTDAIKVTPNRQRSSKPAWEKEEPEEPERHFDERDFLEGKINIINDPESETNLPPRAPRKKDFSAKPDWARTVQRKKKERAFERSTSQLAQDREREQEKAAKQYIDVEEVPTKPEVFDEKAYLSGNVPIFDDTPVAPRPMVEEQGEDGPKVYEFQKLAQRRASIDFVDPLKKAEDHAAYILPEPEEEDRSYENQTPFDESAFLEGRLPIVSGEAKPRARRDPQEFKEVPVWAKRVSQDHETPDDESNFSERAFLQGQIPMVKGGTPDLRPVIRPRKKKPQAPVEEAPAPEPEPFDEQAFLAGRVPILGGATEDSALPPREPKKPVEKTLAPWERRPRDDEIYIPATNEFDEKDFLQGKVPVITGDTERQLPLQRQAKPASANRRRVNTRPRAPWERHCPWDDEEDDSGHNQRIPSKTFIRLSRSVSKESPSEDAESEPKIPKPHLKVLRSSRGRKPKYDRSRSLSPGEAARRQKELQEGTTKDVPIAELAYKGTHIPSKTFMRLQSHVDKPDEVKIDPLDRLRPKKTPPKTGDSVDPEKALEQMSIQEHSPQNYFDALEQVVKDAEHKPQVNGVEKPEPKPVPPVPQKPKVDIPVKTEETKVPTGGGIKVISMSSPQPKPDDMPIFAEGEDQVTDF